MVGTRRRATASRSSTEQESRLAIQILQDWMVLILEPVNKEFVDIYILENVIS